MDNYIHHVGLAVWRKKTIILITVGLFSLILFGLQFSSIEQKMPNDLNKDGGSQDDAFLQRIKVKFIEAAKLNYMKNTADGERKKENNLKDIDKHKKLDKNKNKLKINGKTRNKKKLEETDLDLGIPYIVPNTRNPYVPPRRIVHFDLKGAPQTVTYFKKVLSLIKLVGATGILIEYEDMFPYSGILKPLSAKNCYTKNQINELIKYAQDLEMDVIPLIQTFGHMEFALKLKEFAHLREVPNSPQALCPSRNSSLDFLNELVNQVLDMHPFSNYIHIGCDEVFEIGECEICEKELHETLFSKHVQNVANIILKKRPNIKIIIWDDMLRHMSLQNLQSFNLGQIVEPMIWVYAEEIYRFVQPIIWEKYVAVFKTAWTASAFKGAFGETLYIPNARRHLENNLHWLDVMSTQTNVFKNGLRGIVLTGWQRYDHFAVLCEMLPAALPSLVLNLLATSNGFFNATLKSKFLSALSCPQPTDRRSFPFINLDIDPYMWEKLSRCMFPGNGFFKLLYRFHNMEYEAKEYIDVVTTHKAWLTEYNVKYNYSLPLRVDELTQELPRIYHGMIGLAKNVADVLIGIVDNYTISEWIEQRIYPFLVDLEKIQNRSLILKNSKYWSTRPMPILKDLKKLGIRIR